MADQNKRKIKFSIKKKDFKKTRDKQKEGIMW